MALVLSILLLALTLSISFAQYPAEPVGLTVLKSKVDSEVTISFKQIEVCERTAGLKSYSGPVHLPGSILSDVGGYAIRAYFLYFEARNKASTAPLAIYHAGGLGESSAYVAFASEGGPCYVTRDGTDTKSNPWSLNNHANMLYIDQIVSSGFSYHELVHATFSLAEGGEVVPSDSNPKVMLSKGYGTFPGQKHDRAPYTTKVAAKQLWVFAEHWLSSFPGYSTQSKSIALYGNSYGGFWAPETAVQISKNLKDLPAEHPLKTKDLRVDALGLTNALIDIASQMPGYPVFVYNNTYGIRFGPETLYNQAMHNITKSGGALDQVAACRSVADMGDPEGTDRNSTVNELCQDALEYFFRYVNNAFPRILEVSGIVNDNQTGSSAHSYIPPGLTLCSQRAGFDVAQGGPNYCIYYLPVLWYLNKASVQQAIGVPLNFSYVSSVVAGNFGESVSAPDRSIASMSGDAVRRNSLSNVEYLLVDGAKVFMVFGDRDYRAPWMGGEAMALALKWKHQTNFANAGYEQMQGITTPGAVIKQYGKLSFARLFDSGHEVNAYAPETVNRIFDRAMSGLDVVTGAKSVGKDYHTTGPTTSWSWRNTLPPLTQNCMVEGQLTKSNPWDVLKSRSN